LGQLGSDNPSASLNPLPVRDWNNKNVPLIEAKQITAGNHHACALLKNGKAFCWGDNTFGQIGNDTGDDTRVSMVMENEKAPKAFEGIQSIIAGGNSTCLIAKEDQSLFCFGEKYGSKNKINWIPEKIDISGRIETLTEIKQVSLGDGFGCALSRSQVYCWGKNDHKQLGHSYHEIGTTKASPVEVHYPKKSPLSKIESIAAGDKHACALHREEGTVFCWGDNSFGQLGTNSSHGLPEQVAVSSSNFSVKRVKTIAAGRERNCIISSKDELFCWGNGAFGILGNSLAISNYPERVKDSNNDMLNGSTAVSIGYDHSCVIGTNKKLFCFGLNQYGQLGSRMFGSSTFNNVHSISTYGQKSCVIYGEHNSVGCFGESGFELEEIKNNLKPYQGSSGVSVGENQICIINAEQQVVCIDYATKPANHYVVQGENKTPLKDIWKVLSRGKLNCGLSREKGEIWCWGDWKKNQWPMAKQLTFAGKPTSDFIQFSMSDEQICGAHGIHGDVYCTADNESAQNASNLQSVIGQKNKPFTGVFNLSAGKNHTCAMNDQSQVFCWGSNELDQLGVKSEHTLIPQRVLIEDEKNRKINHITTGDAYTCFTTEKERSLFCFGNRLFNEGNSSTPLEYPL